MARTWQQLTAAALATGTFADYQGDGATVPYEMAASFSTLAGQALQDYKAHLDASYPAAFRLHDWCYTPYGSLIGVTRSEADQALRIQIVEIGGPTSGLDAEIVGLAVAVGGGPWFGNSEVGFDQGLFNQVSGAIWRFPAMAIYKLSVGLERTAGSVKAGFTETWFFERATDAEARAAIQGYSAARSVCLSNSWKVGVFTRLTKMSTNCRRFKPQGSDKFCCVPRTEARVQCVCPAPLQGRQDTGDQGWDGVLIEFCSEPVSHVGCKKCQSEAKPFVRNWIMRGIPDAWFSGNDMSISPASLNDIRRFVENYLRDTLKVAATGCNDACATDGETSCTAAVIGHYVHVCIKPTRQVKRSVGRPFFQLRGRRSNRPTA